MSTLKRIKNNKRIPLVLRVAASRPRLAASLLLIASVYLIIPYLGNFQEATRSLIAWNVGIIVFLLLILNLVARTPQSAIAERAQTEDEGQMLILFMVFLAVVFSIDAIVAELAVAKNLQGMDKWNHIGLTVLTIVTSWLFTHTIFALHYAHDFYANLSKGSSGGLSFPECADPDYFDFLYFSFIIGTSAQTADVSITSKSQRRISLVHCVFAFFFNTTLLALTINIGSNLI